MWADLIEQWRLIEIDFTVIHHLELEDELPRRSWRWFGVKVAGLLAEPRSLLAAHFRPDDAPRPEGT